MGSVGDAVTLNCSARGSPLPRVTWFKSGKRVVSTEEDDGSDLLKSGVVIPSFQHSDAGVYTCLFYNDKNMTTEATTSLSKYECFVSKTILLVSQSLMLFSTECGSLKWLTRLAETLW